MKLDILTHELDLSGAPRTAQEVANYLVEKGHEVRVIVVGGAGSMEPILRPNIDRIFFRCRRNGPLGRSGYILTAIISVARYLLTQRPRMLMVWGKEFTLITTVLCRVFFIKTVITGVSTNMVEHHLRRSSSFQSGL